MAMNASPRFVLRMGPDQRPILGAWWPRSRVLGSELADLFASWPTEAGRIVRVLYSPPDWDDRPRSAPVAGRRIKTGCFPQDDTHRLVLTMLDGRRIPIGVIPSATAQARAAVLLDDAAGPAAPAAPSAGGGEESFAVWDNEGGPSPRSEPGRGHPPTHRPDLPLPGDQ
ncbi:DUF5994 family protein [Nocardioides sp. BP30]|uniref:DUF5994 family protein n=1 Tax=Nocardioides sp. BP30 TaxID=3036374 RepID=UPI0024685988|nr:DUF5994 family protein [Nocardioides sp. BP30]WGL50812.1 DUF5994 family protein [Nocardioides sp. BP30]